MEVLHKYLTTPQFITILSGDAHLYSILIRDKQWGNFSDRLLKMETVTKAERTEYKDTVAHLEEQYFMKLLKQERRVFLSSLYQKIQYDGNTVIEIGIDEKNNKELYIMYSELMDKLGTEKSDRKDSFRFLASQPLRTQKQLLYAFHKSQRDLDQSIIDIFWTDLASKKIDVSSLRNAPQHVTIHILDYLVRNNIISEGFGLAPIFSDPLMNGAQFALSAITSEQLYKDPTLVFDYWLRVCMAREMSKLMGDRAIAKGEGPSLQNFIDHCALNQSKATRYLARHSTAYMRAFRGYNFELKKMNLSKYEQGAWHGTLPLYARAEKSKDGQHSETDKIDYVLDVADPFVRIIGAMPLSGATDHNRRALPIYSIYNLLGILGQLISKARENAYDPKVTYKKVAGILYWNAQFREYPLPSWASSFTSEPSENDDYGINELVTIDKLYEFSKSMTNWALINLKYNISTSMLGNVFTRLFYTLNNLDKGLPSPLLADWFHRTIIIFLHSVLTVEAMDQLDITGLGLLLTNPVKSDKVFIINLNKLVTEKIHENSDQLLFSKWILSCPIWELFLDHSDTNLIANISAYTAPFLKSHTPAPATPAPAQPADATPADATPADLSPITTEINIWSQFNVYNNISKSLVLVKGNEQIIKEESITGEAVVTKIKTNFISNRKAHLADLKKFLAGKAVSKDDVLNMQNQVLADFMKEGLGDKYTIRLKVASAIKDRIVAGRLTWP